MNSKTSHDIPRPCKAFQDITRRSRQSTTFGDLSTTCPQLVHDFPRISTSFHDSRSNVSTTAQMRRAVLLQFWVVVMQVVQIRCMCLLVSLIFVVPNRLRPSLCLEASQHDVNNQRN